MRDALGAESAVQTVTVNVLAVNYPPIAEDLLLVVYEDSCFAGYLNREERGGGVGKRRGRRRRKRERGRR